jgi:hypothetical protein
MVLLLWSSYATPIWQVANASSSNRAYKVKVAKAKHKYIEKRETPKFQPTDIVPLVNKAFLKSFRNRKKCAQSHS